MQKDGAGARVKVIRLCILVGLPTPTYPLLMRIRLLWVSWDPLCIFFLITLQSML